MDFSPSSSNTLALDPNASTIVVGGNDGVLKFSSKKHGNSCVAIGESAQMVAFDRDAEWLVVACAGMI